MIRRPPRSLATDRQTRGPSDLDRPTRSRAIDRPVHPASGLGARPAARVATPGAARLAGHPARLAAALAAVLLATTLAVGGRAALVEATSWIDTPLDGTVLPFGPVSIVTHSADQAGVQEVRLEVDGVIAGTVEGDGSRLFTARFAWEPPAAGTYLLTVAARGPGDAWGATAAATIIVGAGRPLQTPSPSASSGPGPSTSPGPSASAGVSPSPTPSPGVSPLATPTPTPSRTPPPTPAPTPTELPCEPPAPTLIFPVDYVTVGGPDGSANPPMFEWDYVSPRTCLVSGFLVRVYNYVAGYDTGEFEWPGNTWTPPAPLPANSRTECGIYNWYVMSVGPDGPGEPSIPGQFYVCP